VVERREREVERERVSKDEIGPETMSNLAGSENMTDEFNRWWEDQYKIRTPETLQSSV
jgi:hypothetical protein